MSTKRRTSRAGIIAAGRRLLDSNGVAATLEDVARAAGVSRQAVYLHFPSRNALILAVAEDARVRAGAGSFSEALMSAETPRELLRRFARSARAFHDETARAQLSVEALCRTDARLAAAWRRRPVGRLALARDVVRRLADAKRLAVSVEHASDILWALAGPALYDLLVSQRGWSRRRYEEQLSRLCVAALVLPAAEDVPFDQRPTGNRKKGS